MNRVCFKCPLLSSPSPLRTAPVRAANVSLPRGMSGYKSNPKGFSGAGRGWRGEFGQGVDAARLAGTASREGRRPTQFATDAIDETQAPSNTVRIFWIRLLARYGLPTYPMAPRSRLCWICPSMEYPLAIITRTPRVDFYQLLKAVVPAHPRHADIHDHQVDFIFPAQIYFKGLFSGRRGQGSISELPVGSAMRNPLWVPRHQR